MFGTCKKTHGLDQNILFFMNDPLPIGLKIPERFMTTAFKNFKLLTPKSNNNNHNHSNNNCGKLHKQQLQFRMLFVTVFSQCVILNHHATCIATCIAISISNLETIAARLWFLMSRVKVLVRLPVFWGFFKNDYFVIPDCERIDVFLWSFLTVSLCKKIKRK